VSKGLSIESASSIIARDMIQKHMHTFGHVLRTDRAAGQSTIAAFADGLAGATALAIAGGLGAKREVIDAVVAKLRDSIERDLKHLGRGL
jgi:hypothetical protein